MNRHPTMRSVVVALMVPAMLSPLWAETPVATLTGRILAADAKSPVASAVVKVSRQAGKVVSSPPTRPDGSFTMSELSPGVYEVIVDTDEGLYKVASPLSIEAGKIHTVQLALQKDLEAQDLDDPAAGGGGGTGGGGDTALKVLIGIALVLGATTLVIAIDDDPDTTVIVVSPSGP